MHLFVFLRSLHLFNQLSYLLFFGLDPLLIKPFDSDTFSFCSTHVFSPLIRELRFGVPFLERFSDAVFDAFVRSRCSNNNALLSAESSICEFVTSVLDLPSLTSSQNSSPACFSDSLLSFKANSCCFWDNPVRSVFHSVSLWLNIKPRVASTRKGELYFKGVSLS